MSEQNWLRVNFECDSLILWKEVFPSDRPTCWAIASTVEIIEADLARFKGWKIASSLL